MVIIGVVGRGAGGCSSWQSKCISFDAKEETAASNNWIGCNFTLFRGHTFIKSTKNGQLYDTQPTPSAKMNNRSFV